MTDDDIIWENFVLKMSTAISYFIDHSHGDSSTARKVWGFPNLGGFDFSEVKKTMQLLGISLTEKQFKSIKNRYYRKLEMEEDEIQEGDEKIFMLSPLIYFRQFNPQATEAERAMRAGKIDYSSMATAHYLFQEICHYYGENTESLLEYKKLSAKKIFEEAIDEVVMDFLMSKLMKYKEKLEKLVNLKDRIKIYEESIKIIFEIIEKNMRIIDIMLPDNEKIPELILSESVIKRSDIDWVLYLDKLMEYVRVMQDDYVNKFVKKYFEAKTKKMKDEQLKEYQKKNRKNLVSELQNPDPKFFRNVMEEIAKKDEIFKKYSKILEDYLYERNKNRCNTVGCLNQIATEFYIENGYSDFTKMQMERNNTSITYCKDCAESLPQILDMHNLKYIIKDINKEGIDNGNK